MLARRFIACLDVRDGVVVKGVNFGGLMTAGDPAVLARRHAADGIDELVVLDVTATIEGRRALAATVSAIADDVFIPLAAGGGIRSVGDASPLLASGADKVTVNSGALDDPSLIRRLADRYGSQAVVVAIDVKRTAGGWAVFGRSGTADAARDAVEWAQQAAALGAGEILLTSIDRDGTRRGFDCEVTAAVSRAVPIPVIASGGGGSADDFVHVFGKGLADAALASSIFHFGLQPIAALKAHVAAHGVPVRRALTHVDSLD